jgi:hypothetical protein
LRVALITATTAGGRRTRIEHFGLGLSIRDFGTATDCGSDFIFLLTSFFNDSIHQLVATKDRCKISMNNGRENRTNGNEKEGEKEKEALRKFSMKSNRGTQIASPKFFAAYIRRRCSAPTLPDRIATALFSGAPGKSGEARPRSAALLRLAPDLGCAFLLRGTDCGRDRSCSDNQPSD